MQFHTTLEARVAPRVVLNAVEGWGKTSTVANIPGVAIIQAAGETGYETLANAGRVPAVPHVTAADWLGLKEFVGNIDPTTIKALALDALGGIERLCEEYVNQSQFKGEWADFSTFGRGADQVGKEWPTLLSLFDKLARRGVAIIILSHSRVETFKNPMGSDFDRYVAACHRKTWDTTHKWADAVLFGTYFTVVEGAKDVMKKGKATKSGTARILYAERRDAFDAKNRYGMPADIDIDGGPETVWPLLNSYFGGNNAQAG